MIQIVSFLFSERPIDMKFLTNHMKTPKFMSRIFKIHANEVAMISENLENFENSYVLSN